MPNWHKNNFEVSFFYLKSWTHNNKKQLQNDDLILMLCINYICMQQGTMLTYNRMGSGENISAKIELG